MPEENGAHLAGLQKRPNRVPWPPIITIGAVISGWLLQQLMPVDWLAAISLDAWPVGVVMVAGALSIDVWAFQTFKKAQTTILPTKAASNLATNGPFSWSRNPIYVGNIVLILGIGLWSGIGWMLLTAICAAIAIEVLAIRREEIHLQSMFGDEWEKYTKKVRRWL